MYYALWSIQRDMSIRKKNLADFRADIRTLMLQLRMVPPNAEELFFCRGYGFGEKQILARVIGI